jgi:hypothetical protein
MDNFVIGNMVWNGGLVMVAGFFIKRWMNRVDGTLRDNQKSRESDSTTLDGKIEKIYMEIKTANGRTAKIEGKVDAHIAVCDDRNQGRRAGDACL